jgi:hypothetical protein
VIRKTVDVITNGRENSSENFLCTLGRMGTHDPVMAFRTVKALFAPVMRAYVLMVDNTGCEGETVLQGLQVEDTIEVDPFPAVICPDLSPAGFGHSGVQQGLLKFSQVFTGHGFI